MVSLRKRRETREREMFRAQGEDCLNGLRLGRKKKVLGLLHKILTRT